MIRCPKRVWNQVDESLKLKAFGFPLFQTSMNLNPDLAFWICSGQVFEFSFYGFCVCLEFLCKCMYVIQLKFYSFPTLYRN